MFILDRTKCEGDIEYVCANYRWVPSGSDACVIEGYCMTNEQCDDEDMWTMDSCKKTVLQQTFNQKGQCKHTNVLPFILVGFGFLVLLGIAAIAGVYYIKTKK